MTKLTFQRKDFSNNNEVRWCPGCGDYALLAALQKALADIGLPPEQHVFISGIGCAGRLPYYMNAYGLHTIHGRATAVATGLKAMRRDLSVWVITGDGDALSIGGNHLIHALRRNVNLNILLVNNEVYGLTKGQFSPTSKQGQVTKTSPKGVTSLPVNPLSLALSSGAGFVARAVDKDPNQLANILMQAHAHKGCSFVEIYQDCHIFNNGAFDAFTQKKNRSNNTVFLQSGEPLLYGENQAPRALQWENNQFITQECKDSVDGLYCHDTANFMAAMSLSQLSFPEYPVPIGVYYQAQKPVFFESQGIQKESHDLAALYRSKASWEHG